MDKKATLGTIIRAASTNEEKGFLFYAAMARKADNERIKAVFERLSGDELEHRAVFEKLLQDEAAWDQGEIEESEEKLLTTLIKTGTFNEMKAGGDWEANTPISALALGIQAEKDSILLYQGIYNQTNSQAVKNMMSRLLEEEKMHLVDLREEMESLDTEEKK